MSIGRVVVSLEPWAYEAPGGNEYYQLRIKAESARLGSDISTTVNMRLDDLESRFDFIFDRAKERLKMEIEAARKKVKK